MTQAEDKIIEGLLDALESQGKVLEAQGKVIDRLMLRVTQLEKYIGFSISQPTVTYSGGGVTWAGTITASDSTTFTAPKANMSINMSNVKYTEVGGGQRR